MENVIMREMLNKYGLYVGNLDDLQGWKSKIDAQELDDEDEDSYKTVTIWNKLSVNFEQGYVGECFPSHLDTEELEYHQLLEEQLLKTIHLSHRIYRMMLDQEEWIIYVDLDFYLRVPNIIESILQDYTIEGSGT